MKDDQPPRSSLAPIGSPPTDMGRSRHKARQMTWQSVARAHMGAALT